MTGEEFKNATIDARLEALGEELAIFMECAEQLKLIRLGAGRHCKEYIEQKKELLASRRTLEEWLNAIGIETLPYKEI